jgi:hypothetical protein
MCYRPRARARREKKTLGEIFSELTRHALTTPRESQGLEQPKAVHGLRPFASRGGVVTNELINRLREHDVY